MPKILTQYKLTVYSDGTTSMIEIPKDKDFVTLLNDCSERTKQSLLVILQIKDLKNKKGNCKINYSDLYNKSVQIVSSELKIERNTVNDKLERQSNCSASEIKQLIEDFFENKNLKLKDVLLKSVSKTKEDQDKEAIIRTFESL